jgi:hypothetical protein
VPLFSQSPSRRRCPFLVPGEKEKNAWPQTSDSGPTGTHTHHTLLTERGEGRNLQNQPACFTVQHPAVLVRDCSPKWIGGTATYTPNISPFLPQLARPSPAGPTSTHTRRTTDSEHAYYKTDWPQTPFVVPSQPTFLYNPASTNTHLEGSKTNTHHHLTTTQTQTPPPPPARNMPSRPRGPPAAPETESSRSSSTSIVFSESGSGPESAHQPGQCRRDREDSAVVAPYTAKEAAEWVRRGACLVAWPPGEVWVDPFRRG